MGQGWRVSISQATARRPVEWVVGRLETIQTTFAEMGTRPARLLKTSTRGGVSQKSLYTGQCPEWGLAPASGKQYSFFVRN